MLIRILSSIIIGVLTGFIVMRWFCNSRPESGAGEDWCALVILLFAPLFIIIVWFGLFAFSSILPNRMVLSGKYQAGILAFLFIVLMIASLVSPQLGLFVFYILVIFFSIILSWLLSRRWVKKGKIYQIILFLILLVFFLYLFGFSPLGQSLLIGYLRVFVPN